MDKSVTEAVSPQRSERRANGQSRISGDVAAVVAAGATTLGSFGIVVSGIWMINLAVN